ncbi:MAG TPA: DUF3465 domain-containing protein [Chitinispirillaceae bacterium]|nr:DUF3465 domain-containing protein [Chitinispirillaceae bacterium]
MKIESKLTSALVFAGILFCSELLNCGISPSSSNNNNNNKQQTNTLDSLLTSISEIEKAFANQDSDVSVFVRGSIISILSDDTVGDAHQRFIIKLSNSQTLLIVHNIDIAPRITGISTGSVVYVHGDYIWNSQGGLIHWTHHDPNGIHENGWIIFNDKKYQ